MRRSRVPRPARWALRILPALLAACGTGGSSAPPPAPPATVDLSRWDPQAWRASEVSLDGPWSFAFDPTATGLLVGMDGARGAGAYDRTITVPFPWNAWLSGVGDPPPQDWPRPGETGGIQQYRGTAWYARDVAVPADWDPARRRLLRFGAVDWRATVYVDGREAATHEGGFDPFEVDVTDAAAPGGSFRVALQVEDRCDQDPASLTGKQGGGWYACAGGLWQSVTMYDRPETHVAAIRDVPGTVAGRMATRVTVRGPEGPAEVRVTWACQAACPVACGPSTVTVPVAVVPEGATVDVPVEVPAEDEWSPESPCLAGRVVEVRTPATVDRVDGYLGARRIRIGSVTASGDGTVPPAGNGLLVNDRLVHVRGALDQAWHPEGLLQYPSVDARRDDLRFLRDAGFNAVRIHIKPEEPRVYAMADVLGLFVIHDLPSPAPGAGPAPGAPWNDAWDRLLEALVARDANHPSILWWVLFNEAWGLNTPGFWTTAEGLAFVTERFERAKALDPTRPVEDNSPTLYDGHARSDLATWHAYTSDLPFLEDLLDLLEPAMAPGGQGLLHGDPGWTGQPWINTEVGGLSVGDTRGDHAYLFHGILNALRRRGALLGYVFTEAYDVEYEANGLRTFDRQAKDFGLDELGLALPDLFGERYLTLGLEPVVTVAPGAALALPTGLSTPSPVDVSEVRVELRRRDGGTLASSSLPGKACGPGHTALGDTAATAPAEDGVYVLAAEARSGDTVLARNAAYVVVDGGEPPVPAGAARLETWGAWADGRGGCSQGGCWCEGDCGLTWTLQGLGQGRRSLRLVAEVAAFDPRMRQTDGRSFPSRLEVDFYGDVVAAAELPDAPNDHRGVRSLAGSWSTLRGAYGQVLELDLGTRDVSDALTIRLRAKGGGLAVFTRQGGRTMTVPRVESRAP